MMTKQFRCAFLSFVLSAVIGCGGSGHGSSPATEVREPAVEVPELAVLDRAVPDWGARPCRPAALRERREAWEECATAPAELLVMSGEGAGDRAASDEGAVAAQVDSAGALATGGRGSGGRGGVASSGGSGVSGMGGGGRSGGGGNGGGGGNSACQQVGTLDSSCAKDTDCVAVVHTTNCCGAAVWLGLRSTEAQPFATLESSCDASYPACGCASGPPTTDDGSTVMRGGAVSASCQGGTCKTFATACGQPCEAGRSCLTCGAQDAGVSVCSLHCSADTNCTEPAYPGACSGPSGICAASNLPCTGQ